MSSHLYVYVGPCIKLPEIETVEIKMRHRCSNSDCKNHKKLDRDFDFCPACGAAAEEVQDKVIVRSDLTMRTLYDLEQKYDFEPELVVHVSVQESHEKEQSYLIPNLDYDYRTENYSADSYNQAMDLDGVQMKKDIKDFTQAHQVIIDAFKKEYGIKLPVVYSVVPYYM
jgi:hypothetical protein